MRRVKKLGKILFFTAAGLLLFVGVLAAVSQTQFFRNRLREAALSNLTSLLDAEISLGELHGNLFAGFSIDSLRIAVGGAPLVTARRIDIQYNIFEIPGKHISVRSFALIGPSITLTRGKDSLWNFTRMIRPSPRDSGSTSGAAPWAIDLDRIGIEKGSLVLVDSAALAEPGHAPHRDDEVEFHRFQLHDLNLDLSAAIKQNDLHVVVRSFSFASAAPRFTLRKFSVDFSANVRESRVKDLLVQTDLSKISLNASLAGMNVLQGIDLPTMQKKRADLSLKAEAVDLRELARFIPELKFAGSRAAVTLVAGGEFGDIRVENLEIRSGQSQLFIKGDVANLHEPSKLLLRAKLSESRVRAEDVAALLPGLDLPDLGRFGAATLNAEVEGTPSDFRTKFYFETAAGVIRSNGLTLATGGPQQLKYHGQIAVENLNLAAIIGDPSLESSLNATFDLDGEGVAPRTMKSAVTAAIDSSMFRGEPLLRSRVVVEAASSKFKGKVNLHLGQMETELAASLDLTRETMPVFSIDGRVVSLNLQELTHSPADNSDLTMTLMVEGKGLTWETLGGDCWLDISSSRYGEYRMASGEIRVLLDQTNPKKKRMRVNSNVADITLNGAYDLRGMVDLISFEEKSLRKAFGEKFAVLDSSGLPSLNLKNYARLEAELAKNAMALDADFTVRVKDLMPLSAVTSQGKFDGSGILTGSIRGGYSSLSLRGKCDVDEFAYGTVDSGVLVQDANVSFDISSLKPGTPLRDLAVRLEGRARTLDIGKTYLDTARFSVEYRNENAKFLASSTVNTNLHAAVAGEAAVSKDTVLFRLERLDAAYKDLAWRADAGTTVRLLSNGVALDNLVMRQDSQTVRLTGSLYRGGLLAADVTGERVDLDALRYLLAEEAASKPHQSFFGRADFRGVAAGTLINPTYEATITASDLAFRGVPLGNLSGHLSYKDYGLTTRLEILNTPQSTKPDLLVLGTLPLNLTIETPDVPPLLPPMDLAVTSDGFQMAILDPLLPTFKQMTGELACAITAKGDPGKPDYDGTITIKNCSFLFVPNNISYQLSGKFRPVGERIQVVEASLRNLPGDARAGRRGEVQITGDLALKNWNPGDFNLTANGSLLVVKETTRKSSLEVYGDLFVEIAPAGLRFTGEVENSLFRGGLVISNSSLVFPPTQAVAAREEALSVPMIFIDDTAKVKETVHTVAARYFGQGRQSDSRVTLASETIRSKSFMDGVHYDLQIETSGGNTEIRMIFNPAVSEELVAAIDGKFSIAGDGKKWLGDLTISRAYYNYLKRFDATGTIQFTGDIMNPELNITASYQGNRILVDTTSTTRPEPVTVTIKISGPRLEPKLSWGMTIDGIDYYQYHTGPKSNDLQTDAFAFIATGSFPLTAGQKSEVVQDLRSSLVTAGTSVLTGLASNFLREQTGVISSVDVNYSSTGKGLSESADIRVSAMVLNGVVRYGGTILSDPINNANLSLLYSFGTIMKEERLRNLMFELERRVEAGTLGQTSDLKRINSARLFYRFSF